MTVERGIVAAPLDDAEKATLERAEAVINQGMATFVEVGEALATIRNGKLYRDGYKTFGDYCQDKWGFTDSRARQLTTAAKIAAETKAVTGVTVTDERTARELNRVPKEQRVGVVTEAAKSGSVTSKSVKQAASKPPPKKDWDADPLIDPAGRQYTDRQVMHALGQTGEFDKLVNEINAFRRRVAALADKEVGKEIRLQSIEDDCRNISGALRFAKPWTTCPYMPNCKRGCKLCGGTHWITREQATRVPTEDWADSRPNFGSRK